MLGVFPETRPPLLTMHFVISLTTPDTVCLLFGGTGGWEGFIRRRSTKRIFGHPDDNDLDENVSLRNSDPKYTLRDSRFTTVY